MFIKSSSNKLTYNSKPNALRPTPVHDLFEKEISWNIELWNSCHPDYYSNAGQLNFCCLLNIYFIHMLIAGLNCKQWNYWNHAQETSKAKAEDLFETFVFQIKFSNVPHECSRWISHTRKKFSPEGWRWIRPKASATGSLNILIGLTLKECTVSLCLN